MSRIMITDLPDPPEGEQWCAVCVGAVKAAVNDSKRVIAEVQAASGDGKPDGLVLITTEGIRGRAGGLAALQIAVTWAPAVQVPGAPIVPLCWTHAPAIEDGPKANGKKIAPASGAIPPGLLRGQG